jgi:hypothetical protein
MRQDFGRVRPFDEIARAGRIRNMYDERVEPRPPLGLENPRHRLVVARIRAEAIDRLGRKGHETARPPERGGTRDPV